MSGSVFLAKQRIADAIEAVNTIQTRLSGLNQEKLGMDEVLVDACCYRICIVGEAVSYAKEFAPSPFAATPVSGTTWDGLIEVRNHFIHNYNRATAQAVWMFYRQSSAVLAGLGSVLGKL